MKKLETKLNNLWNKIKTLGLSDGDISFANLQGFLYSCGRINILQVVVSLSNIAIKYGMSEKEIKECLE